MKTKLRWIISICLLAATLVASGQTAPVVSNDNASLDEDTSVLINILANDTDAENDIDPATVTILTNPNYGTIEVQAGDVLYTPNQDFFGWDSFTYSVTDLTGNTASGTVNITVFGINDAPTSADRTITINEDESYTFSGADFIYNDVDGDCFNGFKIMTELTPDLGELLYDESPVVLDFIYADPELLTFIPTPNINGTTEFDFRVVDDQGAESGDYTMTIHILGVNDAPASENIVITMPWNSVYGFSNELAYTDVEEDPQAGFVLTSLPSDGQLAYNGFPVAAGLLYEDFSLLSFTPADNEHGSPYTTFSLLVEDDQGAQSPDVLVTVNVLYEEYELVISQGFSPNGDDVNDLWYIKNIDRFPANKIQIYNRWGSLIRTVEGYDNETRAWRGGSDNGAFGTEVADGSYFFIISLGDGSDPIQGYVVLHR